MTDNLAVQKIVPASLDYLPEKQREIAARLLSGDNPTSAHGTTNDGNNWCIPQPGKEFFTAFGNGLRGT